MIDYTIINNKIYLDEQIQAINISNDRFMLINEFKRLSHYVSQDAIDIETALKLKNAFCNRINELKGLSPSIEDKEHDNGRSINMTPTAVSNRNGAVSLTLLLTGISATAIMYALLLVSHFIK